MLYKMSFLRKCLFLFLLIASISLQAQSSSYSLYIFLLDDCKISQSYTIKINQLHAQYGEQINFIGVFPNRASSLEDIEAYKEKYNHQFPMETDYDKEKALQFGVTITPEVVLIDNETQEILYQGRIDDEFVRVGKRRSFITTDELANALESLVNNQPITVKKTEAVGCFINFFDNFNE
jgi:hypothetical protein